MFHSSPSSSLPSPSESQQPLAASHTAHAVAESTKICGHDVFFPAGKRPFSSQKSVISKALIALNKGHNALLESPTGTGKTLALLTSTLSWQQKQYEQAVVEYEEKQLEYERQQSRSSVREDGVKQEVIETKVKGSGDCVVKQEMKQEMVTSDSRGLGLPGDGSVRDQAAAGSSVSGASGTSGKSRAPTPPKRKKIYFCARTHSQLQQSVDELKNCHSTYLESLTMCVLSSRKNLCVNDELLERARRPSHSAGYVSVDEGCQNLLKESRCRFNNIHSTQRVSEELSKSGVWDIEDAVWMQKSCPYFASRKIHQSGPAVSFAPYAYLLNSSIREATGVDLKDAIVVFDEAHNIESACREAASCEVFLSALKLLRTQLRQGSLQQACGCPISYRALHDLVEPLTAWLTNTSQLLEHSDLQHGTDHIWAGAEVLTLFAEQLQLTTDTLAMFSEHLMKVVAAEEEEEKMVLQDLREGGGGQASYINVEYEDEDNHDLNDTQRGEDHGMVGGSSANGMKKKGALATFTLQLLKDLFRIFDYMLRDNAKCIDSYKLVVLKQKRGRDWDVTLNLWCLSASVAFRDFSECHSIMLTSGTLSPLDSFSAELGTEFAVRVEAKHVIDTDAQVFATAVSKFGNVDLKCTYQFHDDMKYQDALGNSLLSIRQASSAGMLIFFPSYGLLDKVVQRWTYTGLIAALGASGSGASILDDDNDTSGGSGGQGEGGVVVEPRDGKELDEVLANYYRRIDSGLKGVLMAVCRGKVSEGIDFADEYARTVCVVGIPFPSVMDLQVKLKRTHQDELCKSVPSGGNLPGDKWYCQEAFRAINQAVGRCIRHIKDFGAIILLDPRFSLSENQAQMSKWLRGKIVNHEQLGDVLVDLRSFTHANRVMFSEHLAAWRRSHAPPDSAPPLNLNHPGHSRAGLSAGSIKNGKGGKMGIAHGSSVTQTDGMSGKQRAVAGMFGKLTNRPKAQVVVNAGSSTKKDTSDLVEKDNGGSGVDLDVATRLSDFSLDYFVVDMKCPTAMQVVIDRASRDQALHQARSWKLSTACLTKNVSPSEHMVFGLDQDYDLWDIMVVKLPPELTYLSTHLFRRDCVVMTDVTASKDSSSFDGIAPTTYAVPVGGATYAVSLESWSWPESLMNELTVPDTSGKWRVRELWVPEDEIAYRLLEYACPFGSVRGRNTKNLRPHVLVAATVVGASKRRINFVDFSWINIEFLLLLLSPLPLVDNCSNSSSDYKISCPRSPSQISNYLCAKNIQAVSQVEGIEGIGEAKEIDLDIFSVSTQPLDASPLGPVFTGTGHVLCPGSRSPNIAIGQPERPNIEGVDIGTTDGHESHPGTVFPYNMEEESDDDFMDYGLWSSRSRKKPKVDRYTTK